MSTVGAYFILFSAILMIGISFGYHMSDDIASLTESIRNIRLKKYFTKKYWINRKLKKQGIIKRIYCIMDSYSTLPNCELVFKDKIYHVLKEQTVPHWKIAGIDVIYTLKETGSWQHNSAVFVDYDENNLKKRAKDRLEIVTNAIAIHRLEITDYFVNKFKFLKI